jgi:RimK family alpha-L-glutamate ligase
MLFSGGTNNMVKIGILTRNPEAWCSMNLIKAFEKLGAEPVCLRFSRLVAKVGSKPVVYHEDINVLEELGALVIRPIGRGSLDECIFRMDILHRLTRLGLPVINHPSAIEKCIDKYYALTILEEHGIPVPKTVVTESAEEALKAFHELGGDVVIKPLFGSRGVGITRISDPEIATRIFRALQFTHNVLYIQEFIPHGTRDIRAFVINEEVVASMYREGRSWKTNVAQGAVPKMLKLVGEAEELAIKATKVVGCEIAGVDILEGPNGLYIVEINSQPGWRGIQTVTKVNIAEAIAKYVIERAKR